MTRRSLTYHTKDNSAAKKSTPVAVANVLQTALRKYGLDGQIARYQWVLHWEEIVGKEIAKRTKPECLRGKTLVIRVTDSTWAQELSFHKEVILRRLKKHMNSEEVVDDVFFYVGGSR